MKLRGIIVFLLLMLMTTGACVANQDVTITIDGERIYPTVSPKIVNGRTLVPMRAIFESLGADVAWEANTQTVTGIKGNSIIKLQIGKTKATLNKQNINLDAPAVIERGSTLVPVRFIAESLGAEVNWDHVAQRVIINNPDIYEVYVDDEYSYEYDDFHYEKINFKDQNLEIAIRRETNKPTGNILQIDVQSITELDLYDLNITNISGIENLINLKELSLNSNPINDISALSNLKNLKHLSLIDNYISDISPLSRLTNLESLVLKSNDISDINVLSNLINLKCLYIHFNEISDISSLSKLIKLEELTLRSIGINDISTLSNLINLEYLDISWNNISDISGLGNLTNLEYLDIRENGIKSTTVLDHLTNLEIDN